MASNDTFSTAEDLSLEELKALEAVPQTRKDKILENIKILLPLVFGSLAIIEYLFVLNAPLYAQFTISFLYVWFLLALITLYTVTLLLSFRKKEWRDQVVYMAPFITFVFALLILYDLLTLKSAFLQLPYFPWVDRILNAIISDRALLWQSAVSSLKLLFTGYAIGAVTGLITGILIGYSKRADYWISPILRVVGPIPTITWIPIVMVLFASLYQASVFIIALGVWYSMTISTMTGIKNVSNANYEAARTLGAKERQLVYKIAIPGAMPNIFQGLLLGMSSACTSLIAAEMMGSESGLGWYIQWQKSWAEYDKMYGAIIILAITFIVVNYLLNAIRDYNLRWQGGSVK